MENIELKPRLLQDQSHISPDISIQLAENVEGFQERVKEILVAIEQDGNFSEMTAGIYDDKKSYLTANLSDLWHMHRVLADQHIDLIGELSRNRPSLVKNQPLESCGSSSSQATQMFAPDQNSNTLRDRSPIGFGLVLSPCGGGFYISKTEDSESSFPISSDPGSESFMSTNKLSQFLLRKSSHLEDELVSLKKKLPHLADENTKLKNEIQENESDTRTQNVYLETEKAKVIDLQKQVDDLKLVISYSDLKAKKKAALLNKLIDSQAKKILRLQEKIVSEISVRENQIKKLNTKNDQYLSEISQLKSTHEAKEDTLNANIERLNTELEEKGQTNDNLSKNFCVLMLEKDRINSQLHTLKAEKRSQEKLIRELETRLSSLEAEHVGVLASFDNVQEDKNQLTLRVVELEREVDRQREVIFDRAEEKREVINRLSSSLKHYMSRYKELRQAFVRNKMVCCFGFYR